MKKETMKKAAVLPTILIILGTLASQAKSPELSPVALGQTEARVGQLVIFSAVVADNYSWKVVNKDYHFGGVGFDYKIISGGSQLVFSAEQEGTYLIICAMAKGSLIETVIHRLVVANPEPVKPEPEPDLSDFEIMVKSWLPEGYDRIVAARLAYSFDLAATLSVKDNDIDSFLRMTTLSNRAALGSDLETWMPFLKRLSDYCQKNMQDASFEEHVQLWLHVSAALRK